VRDSGSVLLLVVQNRASSAQEVEQFQRRAVRAFAEQYS
jgi:hypothetical protein